MSHDCFVPRSVQLRLTKSEYPVFKVNGRRGMVCETISHHFRSLIGPGRPFLAGRLGS